MFTSFFYLLRARGLKVSLNEWMSLIEALDKGLHNSSFTGFYYLARAILVKSEADFDKFDGAFLEYFKDMERATDELPQELIDWLNKPREELDGSFTEEDLLRNMGLSEEEIDDMYAKGEAAQWSAADTARNKMLKEWGYFWDPDRQCARIGM